MEELRQEFYRNAGRNLFLAKELVSILQSFESRGIAAIPYKGPVLAASVYGSLAFRQFGDLDILVREREYGAAQRLLLDGGFCLAKAYDHEATFADSTGRVAVDLHRAMTDREISCPLSFQYLWQHVEPVKLGRSQVLSLSRDDTLLMLALQITKDTGGPYLQLAKICDVAELVRRKPGVDLTGILCDAKTLGCERMVLYTLRLANTLLGTVLPGGVLRALKVHRLIEPLVGQACRELFEHGTQPLDARNVNRFRRRMRERMRDKLQPYSRRLTGVLAPCELDRRLIHLPRPFSFLYYFVRPLRLAGKHGAIQMRRAISR
jgi:hypothetical protein